VAGLFVAGCGTGGSMAQYRLVQTIPDAPSALAVSMNGKSAFTNLAFGTVAPVSAYQSIAAGSTSLEAFLTGTTTPVIGSTTLNLIPTSQSTVLLTGLYAAPTAIAILG
jgi:hypothetical protein